MRLDRAETLFIAQKVMTAASRSADNDTSALERPFKSRAALD
jgi:hypothetical protein